MIAEIRRSTQPDEREAVEAVFGNRDASVRDLAAAQACLHRTGVVERLERRIDQLRDQANAELDPTLFNPQGRSMLSELSDRLTVRSA